MNGTQLANAGLVSAALQTIWPLAGLTTASSAAANFGFDVTPHRLMTGLITEKGIFPATRKALATACAEG